LVAEHGIEAFNIAYRLAKSLGEWEALHSYAIYEKPDLEFNDRYFPDFQIPENVTKALIVGTQGTGKSWQLKKLIQKWLKKGYGVVSVTMSDSLKKQSCDKWGLSTIEAIWNGNNGNLIKKQSQESLDHQLYIGENPSERKPRSLTGFMGCADSMYKLHTKIKELVVNGVVKGFILILDEV
ncbi:MAG: ATP-binding protein, partial [Sphaerospermopsis kisseleviana]